MHYSDLIYKNKYDTYQTFFKAAGDYSLVNESIGSYTRILAASQNVLLLCDDLSKPLLLEFVKIINSNSSPIRNRIITQLLNKISDSFNRELSLLSMSNNN